MSATANNQLSSTGYSYDLSGNMLTDNANTYAYNAESEIKSAAGVNYKYDGDGNRVYKSNGKIYWYGAGTEILDESDGSGNFTNEYVFFGGKRVAMRTVSSGTIYYYEEDMLGSSRTIVQAGQTTPCYDGDFYPFGGERVVTNTCAQNYKFEGKERDTESGNDDFGARYYSSRLGRWLSADWSSVPVPVPYANLSNPQTLNLYAMVSDNPETFADLDGHQCIMSAPYGQIVCDTTTRVSSTTNAGGDKKDAPKIKSDTQNAQGADAKVQADDQQLLVSPDKKTDIKYGDKAREQNVDYNLVQTDSKGKTSPVENPTDHRVELREKLLSGDPKKVTICTGQCVTQGTLTDTMSVTAGKGHSVEKRFLVDGGATKIYDPATKKAYDFVRVDASVKRGFVFNYGNDPH